MKSYVMNFVVVLFVGCFGLSCFAACPSADLTGDCKVSFEDFAMFASQWLDEGSYMLNVYSSPVSGVSIGSSTGHNGITDYALTLSPETSVTLTAPAEVDVSLFTGWTGDVNSTDQTISFSMNDDKTVTATYDTLAMVWVSINDPGVSGHEAFNGEMSKYEIANASYCQFLNAALASGDIYVSGTTVYGANGSNAGADFVNQVYYNLAGAGDTYDGATNGGAARINYTGSSFIVDSGFENHPVTYASWYGSTAFANYYGWRLPTEWEWQAVADFDGTYTYGCGTTINNSIANCIGSTHPDGTTVVGAFGTYGYGMCDMAGNLWEWTDSINSGSTRVVRGGSWSDDGYWDCTVDLRGGWEQSGTRECIGFRVCR